MPKFQQSPWLNPAPTLARRNLYKSAVRRADAPKRRSVCVYSARKQYIVRRGDWRQSAHRERIGTRPALGCLPKFQLSPRLNPVPTLGASEFIQVRCAQRNGERTRPSGSVGTRLFANISTKSRAPSGAYSPGLENRRTRDTPFM